MTLALGCFVESFGNVAYESLGCGTPAIVARVSTHRELLPDSLIDKVDFGDHDTAAAIAAGILRGKRRTPPATLDYLHANFSIEQQLNAYAETILNARSPRRCSIASARLTTRRSFSAADLVLPGGRERHLSRLSGDVSASDAALEALLDAHPDGFSFADAAGVGRDQVMAWYRDGYLVPVQR